MDIAMNTDAEQVIRQRAFEDAVGLLDASWPGEVPSTELAAFFAQSSVHIEEAFQVACVWRQIMALSADQFDQIEVLAHELSAAKVGPVQLVQLQAVQPQPAEVANRVAMRNKERARSLGWLRAIHFPSPGRLNSVWSVARAAVAILSTLLLQLPAHSPVQSSGFDLYETPIGKHRVITLTDGSTIHLNTRSRVSVRFSGTRRVAQLLQGEALFTIQHDPNRPFEVVSGFTVVRDVGTQFDVHRKTSGATVVTVIQGQVDVSLITDPDHGQSQTTVKDISPGSWAGVRIPARLGKDEQITVGFRKASAYAEGRSLSETEIAGQLSWREGRITFDGESFKLAAEEFSRYNNVRFVVGPEIADIHLGGTMSTTDVAGFLGLIHEAFGVRARSAIDESGVRVITLMGPKEGKNWRPRKGNTMPPEDAR
jgi:transmembrane sensor